MKTDLNGVRLQSIILARAVPINPIEFGIVLHPFTNTTIGTIPMKNKTFKMLDLTNKKQCNVWMKYLESEIMDADLIKIFIMLNTPWKLTWLKYCKPYMSKADFSRYLAHSWVEMENPNQDANVSLKEVISWFKSASKKDLMVEEDLKIWNDIPKKITLYRGVGKKRAPFGLSYTADKKKAEWFQNRFHKGEGFLITLEVKKEDIIAYFNTRGEDEYVVDTSKYRKQIEDQIPKD